MSMKVINYQIKWNLTFGIFSINIGCLAFFLLFFMGGGGRRSIVIFCRWRPNRPVPLFKVESDFLHTAIPAIRIKPCSSCLLASALTIIQACGLYDRISYFVLSIAWVINKLIPKWFLIYHKQLNANIDIRKKIGNSTQNNLQRHPNFEKYIVKIKLLKF